MGGIQRNGVRFLRGLVLFAVFLGEDECGYLWAILIENIMMYKYKNVFNSELTWREDLLQHWQQKKKQQNLRKQTFIGWE